jgi:ABC-type multidrug transport system ATPase subunit
MANASETGGRAVRKPGPQSPVRVLNLTIFDGDRQPRTIRLNDFHKTIISFGRSKENDIVLSSPLVSRRHGRIVFRQGQWVIEDISVYENVASKNGLIYNGISVLVRMLCNGDLIRIDKKQQTVPEGVLFVFTAPKDTNRWNVKSYDGKKELVIGRHEKCDIMLPHISTSRQHARIIKEGNSYYIVDTASTNGVIVNNKRISGKQELQEKDVITITNSKLIFTSKMIFYCYYKNGISVDVNHVVITRGKRKNAVVTGNDISLHIHPGELVAIVGGSGAGKSTLLNCMCGYLPPSQGEVYINGVDLYRQFDSLKKLIGYVPQSDIVYDNLTLYDMLSYTARLRLPKDTTAQERETAIAQAIHLVDLTDKKKSLIKSLSGGQRKRASIAVELLCDPNLLFLDEPASGLDPGTERNLMCSLREMADSGKTVILVTHSTLQLSLCDKIIFMGKGGNMCFFGSYKEALRFYRVSNVVDIYNMITEHAREWRSKYESSVVPVIVAKKVAAQRISGKTKKARQLPVLCMRYLKLVGNDRQRLLLLLLQAPVLAVLISFVADGNQFEQYEMTKSLLFSLSCSAFWVGMLNSIQEVCKERTILKREFMAGLSLTSYIVSKIVVLGILCLIQSILIISVFSIAIGLPENGLLMHPYMELLLTTFLTALASTAMGLFVSSLFNNADRAMTVAPILLMPQILFSGLIFKLGGVTETISWLAVCRWSMEGYGTTANLNALPLKLQQQGVEIPHEVEDFFEMTTRHMLSSWGILLFFVVLFLLMARVVLSTIGKEQS